MTRSIEIEKDAALQLEVAMDEDERSKQGDYSGAVAKTDEVEIALVRKLDMRIMPALFCMYFLLA